MHVTTQPRDEKLGDVFIAETTESVHEVFTQALNENKPSIRAKMWAYRGQTIPLNVFDFAVSRHRDGPELFFGDHQGTLLGDCWHGFESIALNSSGAIARAACNSQSLCRADGLLG